MSSKSPTLSAGVSRRIVSWTYEQLKKRYGPISFQPGGDPLEQLIQTILSQNTSDVNSERAYRSLRRRFRSWRNLLSAPTRSVAEAIQQGGLANTKAPRIQAVLAEIRKREGRFSLARLNTMPVAQALQYLTSLPGVGMKTASCVLLFSLGRPVMPVDTHVHRVTQRLGWVPWKTPPEQTQRVLEEMVPPNRILTMHLLMVAHGRRLCKALRPRCSECPLARHCAFARATRAEFKRR